MAWTDERIALLKQYWENGLSASQIAELMGENLSRNAVIGKAHRLGLASRPSPLKTSEPKSDAPGAAPPAAEPGIAQAAASRVPNQPAAGRTPNQPAAGRTPNQPDTGRAPAPASRAPDQAAAGRAPAQPDTGLAASQPSAGRAPARPAPAAAGPAPDQAAPTPVGDAAPMPAEAAAPRPARAVAKGPAKGAKVTLLDLNDRICKWPIGHPDEADFHFCGKPVNPGFPYCGEHCLVAYQAQMPRRDRPGGPSRPFGPNLPRPR